MEKSVVLDICKHSSDAVQTMVLRQGDANSLTLNISVNEDGLPFDLSGCEARFMARLRDGKVIIDPCEPAGANSLRYTLPQALTAFPGTVSICYIAVCKGGEWVASTNCMSFAILKGVDVGAQEAESFVSEFLKLKEELEGIVKAAEEQKDEQQSSWLSQMESQRNEFENLAGAIEKALESLETVTVVPIPNGDIDALWVDY